MPTKIFTPELQKATISLLSPEKMLARSSGEITAAVTRNHRTGKPEEGGLFCQRIFGPEESWKCSCGKYKGIRYRGNVCDRCGVEINHRHVRRSRTGHILLSMPVVNPWFVKTISVLLGLKKKQVESITYYSIYVVIQPGVKAKEGVEAMTLLSPKEYHKHIASLPNNQGLSDQDPNKFIAKMGGEALRLLLKNLNLSQLSKELRQKIDNETSQQRRRDSIKRLIVVENFLGSMRRGIDNKPEYMILSVLLVMSPAYRPVIKLSNGRFATSDHTELLLRLMIRNQRLRKLQAMQAPDIIIFNEMRMLQEVVDSLIHTSSKSGNLSFSGGRPLKSLSDTLQGKTGLFRGGSLGKRVDYSGRSVITVGPHLKLNECGLPKEMALILFGPFIIRCLKQRGLIGTYKEGKKMLQTKPPVVWDILQNLVQSHPVVLNRAPTLHKLGLLGFYIKLVEGQSIQLHPLVCTAFNADFDGDQMAVHVPLSQEAIAEVVMLMLSSRNLLNPANGECIMMPTKDMIMGLYHVTKGRSGTPEHPVQGEGRFFSSRDEVLVAYRNRQVNKHARIKLLLEERDETTVIDTVVGRVLFNQNVPTELAFINECIDSKNIRRIIMKIRECVGVDRTVRFLDDIKAFGFACAHEAGVTFGIDDLKEPSRKNEIIRETEKEVAGIWENYHMGLITNTERSNQAIDLWTKASMDMTTLLVKEMEADANVFNTIYDMLKSGARGSLGQLMQMCGYRGLMNKPQRESSNQTSIIEFPILSSFLTGLSSGEYILSNYGGRKGILDTTLKTADAGYFSRKLVEAGQSVFVVEQDCNTLLARVVKPIYEEGQLRISLSAQIMGRITAEIILDPQTKEVFLERNTLITEEIAQKVHDKGLVSIAVRSPIYCENPHGVCVQCYGLNLGTGSMACIGDVVGIIAAQSIAEPGTQLTLRSFQTGGAVVSGSVNTGNVKALESGVVHIKNLNTVSYRGKDVVIIRNCELRVVSSVVEEEIQTHILPYGATILVTEGQKVNKGEMLFEWDPYTVPILTHVAGKVIFESIEKNVTYTEEYNEQIGYQEKIIIESKEKNKVPAIIVEDKAGNRSTYMLPPKSQLTVSEDDEVVPGAVIAKISRSKSSPQDIVGGLPRVIKLFEMQKPANRAVLTSIDGYVALGARKRGGLELTVTSAAKERVENYKISPNKQLLVQDGDYVQAGDRLCEGVSMAEDILHIKGLNEFCNYAINEIQSIYRLQGVNINDKHLEVILRQMLRKVEIISSGDTFLSPEEIIPKHDFEKANESIQDKAVILDGGDTHFGAGELVDLMQLTMENKSVESRKGRLATSRPTRPAIGQLKVQGISRSAITGKSFLAAASFQETVKVLSKAAVCGREDNLLGVKENIIAGQPFPGGTGQRQYKKLRVTAQEVQESLIKASAAQRA